jgi:D-threonate/D-erythronate kinase
MSTTQNQMTGILADDLTGALDGGLQLWKAGLRVSVYLPDGLIDDTQSEVIVFDTESRNSSEKEARVRAADAVVQLRSLGASLAYKKIDSTLRGHPGPELEAILEYTSYEAVLVAPALPCLGRTVQGGELLLNGVPLARTEFADDPLAPIHASSVLDILTGGTNLLARGMSVGQLEAAASNPDLFFNTVGTGRGPSIVVADSSTENDLRTAAQLIAGLQGRVLPCGSAGFLEFLSPGKNPRGIGPSANGPSGCGPDRVIVITSSMSATTKSQVNVFVDDGAVRISPNRASLFSGTSPTAMAERDVLRILEALHDRDVVIDAGGSHADLPSDPVVTAMQSRRLQKYLAETVSLLFQRATPGPTAGLVIAGGETALSVCRALGVRGIDLSGEVEPFVPAGRAIGGAVDGLEIVTKAGGFGTVAVMTKAKEFLTREEPMR